MLSPRHLRGLCRVGALPLALAGLAACTEESEVGPRQPPAQSVNELVETTGWFPAIVPDSTAFSQARFDSTTTGGEGLACADFAGRQVKEAPGLTVLAADPAVHHPGAVLQYAHLDQVTPDLVVADRAGGSLVLEAAAGDAVEGEVGVLDGAVVEAWRQASVADLAAGDGAWDLAVAAVADDPLIPLAAGVHVDAMPEAAWDRLRPRGLHRGRALVRLQRTHHTMTAPYPGRAGKAFADHVLGADVADQMAEGNPPVWVEAVDYGQLALVLVEADADFDAVVAAAINTFRAAATGGAEDGQQPRLHDLPDLTVAAYAPGADADALVDAVAGDLEAMQQWFAAPAGDPAALPAVAADLVALRNGGPLTLGLEAEFWFTRCEPYDAVFAEVLWSLDAADARTDRRESDLRTDGDGNFYYHGGAGEFTYPLVRSVPDLRGRGATSVPDPNGKAPILLPDLAGGRPAIELYELGLPDDHIYCQLSIDGTPLLQTDYTLFLVLKLPERVRLEVVLDGPNENISRANDVNYLMHGAAGNGPRRNLLLGFREADEFVFQHQPYGVATPFVAPEGWHVYAFRFGLVEGMSMWLDGEMIAENESSEFSLLEVERARICARWHLFDGIAHAVVYLAEAVAYQGAGSDAQVAAESQRLREKYGF